MLTFYDDIKIGRHHQYGGTSDIQKELDDLEDWKVRNRMEYSSAKPLQYKMHGHALGD